MYLSRLIIKNYRSIKDLDIKFQKGKNVIVGRNNSGKSNIIKALDIVLGENSPTYQKSENITQFDFYTWKEKDETEIKSSKELIIFCELKRDVNEKLNYDEIYKCYGIYKYNSLIPNDTVYKNLQAVFKINPDTLGRNEKTYLNPKLKNQQPFETEFEKMNHFAYAFIASYDEDSNGIVKDMRFFYKENEPSDWIMAFSASIRNEFLQSAIINSFRDPYNQLRLTKYTWYGKLMHFLTCKHGHIKELQDAYSGVKEIADKIFKQAQDNIQNSSLNVAFPDADIIFQLSEDFKGDIYKDCKIYIDDGFKAPLGEKGSGIQSATIIGLFNFYIKNCNTKSSALLCIEEPELYLHPHARRIISDRLDDFLDNDKNQVIISTHSSEFIRTTDEKFNIILVRKDKDGTNARTVNIKNNKSLLLNNNHNEIFFADKVIICEGFDDYILRWIAEEKFPGKLNENNISIITAGGKDQIGIFVDLILQLNLESFIFTDFDFFLRDNTNNADKYKEDIVNSKAIVVKQKSYRHKSIENINIKFFEQSCIFSDKGKSIYKNIMEQRKKIKKNEEEKFYTAKSADELNDVVAIKGLLGKLRENGVGILESEIEALSKDVALLSRTNKLSLDKIFQISSVMNNENKKISDIIETEPVEKFLEAVLSK